MIHIGPAGGKGQGQNGGKAPAIVAAGPSRLEERVEVVGVDVALGGPAGGHATDSNVEATCTVSPLSLASSADRQMSTT